ncbi:MAG: prephenate dehydratase [Geodermatophilaceae bacterium]|nr:prephenate dehydratase [Geodermatophilaceae bacterium]
MPGVPPTRFAYLGPEGTFAEMALRTLPAAARATLLAQPSVSAAIDSVRDGEADAAVVPLENSVEGSVPSTVDELANGDPLLITREILLPVTFALLVRPGTTMDMIATIATHPHAEAQCRGWLRDHLPHAAMVLANSTAQAAQGVSRKQYDAAVAAPLAGERYRLAALSTGIADVRDAVTRFVLLSRPGPPPEPTGRDKTSLVAFIAEDHTGALLEVLTEFAVRGISLTRIESRPTKDRMGRYCFTLDCEGHLLDARVGQALMALRRICADVRYLGSYPRADAVPMKAVPPNATDAVFADATAWLSRLREGRGQ